jgi:hypothetical protein
MFVGMHAERIFGRMFLSEFVDAAPFLLEEIQDYYSGGLDDMAIQASWWWGSLIDWIENGPPAGTAAGGALAANHADHWFPFDPELLARVRVERTRRGVTISLAGDDDPPAPPLPDASDRALMLVTRVPYSYLGTALAVGDWNGDGRDDLAVGAPGYGERGRPQLGAFYVLFGRDVPGRETIDLGVTGGDAWRIGADDYGRLGWALAACDLNADGRDDLAVSAPTVGAREGTYAGAVFVYLGGDGGFAETPDLVFAGEDAETNLGLTLASGDLDGDGFADLLIGSPLAPEGGFERGRLEAALSSAPGSRVVVLRGGQDGDRLGESVRFVEAGGRRLVLVGAPHHRGDDRQEAGTLLGFDAGALLAGDREPLFALVGDAEFDKTGLAVAAGDFLGDGWTLLAVASPTRTVADVVQAGSIAFYSLEELAAGSDAAPVAELSGLSTYARLGWRMEAADANGDGVADLWVTAPYRETDGGFGSGLAGLYLGGESFPVGDRLFDPADAAWSLSPAGRGAHFGSAIACPDFNGDGDADVAIAARTDSPAARLGGSVRLAITPTPTPIAASPSVVRAGETVALSIYGERFVPEGLTVVLRWRGREGGGSRESADGTILSPTEVQVWDAGAIRATLTVPANAARGRYRLEVRTRFGLGTLDDALLVEGPAYPADAEDDPGDRDDDSGCGCT